ncbi:hypothetical protein DSO57_1003730 [Entomophthora muscae]|uniref:Uncharacterized protein n=1 Tax=Entomophthora muscae TaxID=34485 RepID=A0ACC2SXI1_9FUNG|nr:hypothetical protein DSO57_1003730 [Entomophthora muscae]
MVSLPVGSLVTGLNPLAIIHHLGGLLPSGWVPDNKPEILSNKIPLSLNLPSKLPQKPLPITGAFFQHHLNKSLKHPVGSYPPAKLNNWSLPYSPESRPTSLQQPQDLGDLLPSQLEPERGEPSPILTGTTIPGPTAASNWIPCGIPSVPGKLSKATNTQGSL